MKHFVRNWLWLPLLAGIVLVIDQWSKGWIETNLPVGSMWAPIPALEPWFKLTHWTNTGAAFGLLQGQGGLFVLVAVVVIVVALVYARHLPIGQRAIRFSLGLQLGGALGNLVDRIQLGHVTDFALFTLPLQDRVLAWPAFNVADSSIVVGVAILAFVLFKSEREIVDQPEPDEHQIATDA